MVPSDSTEAVFVRLGIRLACCQVYSPISSSVLNIAISRLLKTRFSTAYQWVWFLLDGPRTGLSGGTRLSVRSTSGSNVVRILGQQALSATWIVTLQISDDSRVPGEIRQQPYFLPTSPKGSYVDHTLLKWLLRRFDRRLSL